jgi:hypothetical protein
VTDRCGQAEACVFDHGCPFYMRGCAEQEPETPPYVHRLLDAFLTGEPLNFGVQFVPQDVRNRLGAAVADGSLGQVRDG